MFKQARGELLTNAYHSWPTKVINVGNKGPLRILGHKSCYRKFKKFKFLGNERSWRGGAVLSLGEVLIKLRNAFSMLIWSLEGGNKGGGGVARFFIRKV